MKSGIGSRPWVGLDIGQFSIKLLTLQTVATKRAVHAERRRPVGEGERPAGSEELAVAISECFSDARLSPRAIRGISLGIAGVDVIIKQISLPLLGDTEVPFEEAEEWKLAAGSDEPAFRLDWSSREMQAISDCLRRDLVEELLRSFAFYRTIGRLPDPLRLWISGGSARLPGFAIRLS